MEWLKSTKWDGKLPLVTGGGGAAEGQGVTPFIEIPTSREEDETQTSSGANSTAASSSILPSSALNRNIPTATE